MIEPTRYTLIWFSMDSMDSTKLVKVRRQIEDKIKEPQESVEIDLWLESPGGDAHAAYKLALILRAAASKIRVVIPDYAKSAATLLALSGDEIYMAPGAELGPLDGQMPDEGSLFGSISALNIARAADDVASTAVSLASRGGAQLFNATGLKREQTLEAMLRFTATFSEPLVRQLDPRLIHDAKQTLRVTKQYAERLLTRTMPRNKATEVATSLVEMYPTHGFVIAYDEAQRLGLPVLPIDQYDRHEMIRAVHRKAEDGEEMIMLFGDQEALAGEDPEKGEPEKAEPEHEEPEPEGDDSGVAEETQTNSDDQESSS